MKISASESKPFQRRNSWLSQAKRMAEPFQIQIAILIQLIQKPNFSCTQFKVLGLAHENFGVWTGPKMPILPRAFYPFIFPWLLDACHLFPVPRFLITTDKIHTMQGNNLTLKLLLLMLCFNLCFYLIYCFKLAYFIYYLILFSKLVKMKVDYKVRD